MKIDPNRPIELKQEYVLCEAGRVHFCDGGSAGIDELGDEDGPFGEFCRGLDPNKCFISALIPDRADEAVFYRARDAARAHGVHMQATIEKADVQHSRWQAYLAMKAARGVKEFE